MLVIIFHLLLSLCLLNLSKESNTKGLVVVPGLGRSDRLRTVVSNLRLLEKDYLGGFNQWDCIIYIYANKSDISFWSLRKQLSYVESLCKIVLNPNGKVSENLHLLRPSLINTSYSKVFIFLDDCKLSGDSNFDLSVMSQTMDQNNLTVISPLVLIIFDVIYAHKSKCLN